MVHGLYEPTSSFLHRADPTAKIIALAAWFIVESLATGPAQLLPLALAVVAVGVATGLGGAIVRFSRFVIVLFIMCVLLWALFSRDPAGTGSVANSLTRGFWVGLRLTTLLATGLLFLSSTRVEEMAAGLHRMGLPFMTAFSLTLSFRLLPLFAVSGATIVQAQACRGLDVREGGPITRLKGYLPLLVPLLLSSLRTAGGLAAALESRGLGMGARRTSALAGRFKTSDAVLVLGSALALAAAMWFRWGGPR